MLLLPFATSLALASFVCSRQIQSTEGGLIALEEAWINQELLNTTSLTVPPVNQTLAEFQANLLDVHNQRLSKMNAAGIDFTVLSVALPGPQGISNPTTAQAVAMRANDELHNLIKNNTQRFGAFATLSMHNPSQAAAELERTVTQYGFLGALINDVQQTGPASNTTFLYYDLDYDIFWQKVVDLNVTVYLHPGSLIPSQQTLLYTDASWLIGSAQQFTVGLSHHLLRLCTNGLFDRFPTLQIIVGHLGERIPSDFWRIDHELDRQRPVGMPMKKTVQFYFRNNLFETTAGDFSTSLALFHVSTMGIDRMLFSVDYPYQVMAEASDWFNNNFTVRIETKRQIARENAIRVLRLQSQGNHVTGQPTVGPNVFPV